MMCVSAPMNVLPRLVRYGSIALAVAGVWQMTQVMEVISAQETPVAPPPVAPPENPFAHGLAATGILDKNRARGLDQANHGLELDRHAGGSGIGRQGAHLFGAGQRRLRVHRGGEAEAGEQEDGTELHREVRI